METSMEGFMIRDWKSLNVGDCIRWYGKEFDGSWDEPCTIKEKFENHLIADCDGIELWIDDWSASQFKKA